MLVWKEPRTATSPGTHHALRFPFRDIHDMAAAPVPSPTCRPAHEVKFGLGRSTATSVKVTLRFTAGTCQYCGGSLYASPNHVKLHSLHQLPMPSTCIDSLEHTWGRVHPPTPVVQLLKQQSQHNSLLLRPTELGFRQCVLAVPAAQPPWRRQQQPQLQPLLARLSQCLSAA